MRKNKIILPVLLILVLFLIGMSFALWQLTYTQTGANIITTECFKVTFVDDNPINILNAFPITDAEGSKLDPYKFTLTNMCNSFATYDINLETLNISTLKDLNHIKLMLNESGQEGIVRLLSSEELVERTLDDATLSHRIGTGYLDYKESKTFELRLCMDEDTPLEEKYMSKTLENKVTVVTSFISDIPLDTRNMMMERYDDANNDNYSFMNNTTKLVFRNKKTNPIGVDVVDISYNKDNSVIAYNDESTGKIVTYIETNGKIKFPQNSKYLLTSYGTQTSIEGLEHVDTRQVLNMENLFYRYSGSSLNLSNFNTSKVTNMNSMFSGCGNLIDIDLSGFDTKNITNMSGLFSGCSSLASLDLSNFDTSNVVFMQYMFQDCSSLTSLDLSGFDTKNVTNMSGLLSGCRSLASLDLSNFDTSQVTGMSGMFFDCYNIVTTITIRNIEKVLSYQNMFLNAANIDGAQVTINYISETMELVDKMILTKSKNSNVIKGVKVS